MTVSTDYKQEAFTWFSREAIYYDNRHIASLFSSSKRLNVRHRHPLAHDIWLKWTFLQVLSGVKRRRLVVGVGHGWQERTSKIYSNLVKHFVSGITREGAGCFSAGVQVSLLTTHLCLSHVYELADRLFYFILCSILPHTPIRLFLLIPHRPIILTTV